VLNLSTNDYVDIPYRGLYPEARTLNTIKSDKVECGLTFRE